MIKIYDRVEQGSEEWHSLRCGILTASEVKLILTEKTLKPSNNDKTRSHVYEIAGQRITNYTEPSYINDDMIRGMRDEIYALELYSKKYEPVKEVGFITNDKLGFTLGYSPDGIVGDFGLVECKSRLQKHQLKTIANNEVPSDYMLQLQAGLLISERQWIDFISYCGGMPMFVKRVYPIVEYQQAIIEASINFEFKVGDVINDYNTNSAQFYNTERVEEGLDII